MQQNQYGFIKAVFHSNSQWKILTVFMNCKAEIVLNGTIYTIKYFWMLNSNLKKATNWGFIQLQVLRLVKTCLMIYFCFVSDIVQMFLSSCLSFFTKKIFLEEVTSKYTTILYIFGTFLDMLREQVSGGSM